MMNYNEYKVAEKNTVKEYNGMTVEEVLMHFAKKLCTGNCDECPACMDCNVLFDSTDSYLTGLTEKEALDALK